MLSPIEQSIKAKIEAVGTPLKDWDITINRGILTGYNEAFIISGEKKDELIAQDPKSAEIIRPILRGRDIRRYGYEFADLWLINTHNGIKGKNISLINVNDYPAIKEHLDMYYDKLAKRSDKGATPYNLRDCVYMEDFSKQKIIFQEMVQSPSFFLDSEKHFVCLDTGRIITGENLEYLTALLNSKLFFYAVKLFYGGGGLGGSATRMKHTFFTNFNAVKPSEERLMYFKKLYYQDYDLLDAELSRFLYESYGFAEDEILAIEDAIILPRHKSR